MIYVLSVWGHVVCQLRTHSRTHTPKQSPLSWSSWNEWESESNPSPTKSYQFKYSPINTLISQGGKIIENNKMQHFGGVLFVA